MRTPKKRNLSRHREDALARADKVRPDITLLLDNIRSMHNVGAIFRTADGFGVRELVLGGYTPAPPRPEISKTAIGAEESVPHRVVEDLAIAVLRSKRRGALIIALEQTTDSLSIYDFEFPDSISIVLGNEIDGISSPVLNTVDVCLEIPMLGEKHSHNVGISAAILMGEYYRQWSSRQSNPDSYPDSHPKENR